MRRKLERNYQCSNHSHFIQTSQNFNSNQRLLATESRMRSFGICALVVLSLFSGKTAVKDGPTKEEIAQLRTNVQDAQNPGYLQKNLGDWEAKTIIANLFKVAGKVYGPVYGCRLITPNDLVEALRSIDGIACNQQTALALIDEIEKDIETRYPDHSITNFQANLYIEAVSGTSRMLRLRNLLTGELTTNSEAE